MPLKAPELTPQRLDDQAQVLSIQSTYAVIVAFHPDKEFAKRVDRIASQVARTIIIDNTPGGAGLEELESANRISVVSMGKNLGMARALNEGFGFARDDGCDWVVTLDQDSTACEQMVSHLHQAVLQDGKPESVAMVGPRIIEKGVEGLDPKYLARHARFPWMFVRRSIAHNETIDVTMIITSGALTRVSTCQDLGGFREDLFIDYVDTDYCLRVKQHGFRILARGNAELEHELGNKRRVRRWGIEVFPTSHAAFRLYYIHRNRIKMYRMYGKAFPHWLVFDVIAAGYNLFRVAFFESDRRAKLAAAIFGTIDGILGRFGQTERRFGA